MSLAICSSLRLMRRPSTCSAGTKQMGVRCSPETQELWAQEVFKDEERRSRVSRTLTLTAALDHDRSDDHAMTTRTQSDLSAPVRARRPTYSSCPLSGCVLARCAGSSRVSRTLTLTSLRSSVVHRVSPRYTDAPWWERIVSMLIRGAVSEAVQAIPECVPIFLTRRLS